MLDTNIKQQLKGYLEKLVNPIELTSYVNDSQASQQTLEFLREVAELSSKVTVKTATDTAGQRVPSFTIGQVDHPARITFAGIPMGHEFTSFVLAILQVSGYSPKVDASTLEQSRQLKGPLVFEAYISLSCQNCPDVVQAINLLAAVNPDVQAATIDGSLYQAEVEERQIMAVPTLYLNGQLFAQGRMSLEDIVAKLDTGAATKAASEIDAKGVFDVLIVGGGPAGAAAAIYSARKGIATGVVAERFGGQVLDTLSIENFISVKETEGPKLARALEEHVKAYDVDIMKLQKAVSLKTGDIHEVTLASGVTVRAKSVVLATGARWRELGVTGEQEYRNKGVAYCPHCDGPLFKGKRVAVVGGGNSGVEAAIDLAGIVAHVTLLEFGSELKADAVLQKKLHSLHNVRVITNAQTTEVRGDGAKVTGLVFLDRQTQQAHTVELEGIFVQIGLLPNTDWLKGSVALSKHGEIEVDHRGETSVPGVFAAGDATTVPYKQIVIAMGEGSKAALSAFDYLIRQPV